MLRTPSRTRKRDLDPGQGLTEHYVALPDGRRIRTVAAGTGSGPLVVFEAGLSAPAGSWIHTQRQVSAHARTLSYDRAGYGGSDVDAHERTIERLSDDLAALLDAAGEVDPVVLVGHSWGGPVLRVFADRNPARVAGLVFVDASLAEGMPAENAKAAPRIFRVLAVLAALGASGLVRKMTLGRSQFTPEISAPDLEIMMRDLVCARAMRAASREADQMLAALPVMERLQAKGTPPVPTVCLQGGRVDRGMAEIRPILNHTAAELMAAVPDGKVVVVEQAGHLIPQECPAPVLDAILHVLETARR